MNLLMIFIGASFGYFVSWFFSGKETGKQGRFKSLIIKTENYEIWLHHWFLSAIALTLLIFLDWYNGLIYGFLIGLIVQGLTYKNFYRIVYKRKL